MKTICLEDFRDSYCVGGIDLSRTTDLTAYVTVIEKRGIIYVLDENCVAKKEST